MRQIRQLADRSAGRPALAAGPPVGRRLVAVEVEFDIGAERVLEEHLPDSEGLVEAAQAPADALLLQHARGLRQASGAEPLVIEHAARVGWQLLARDDMQDRLRTLVEPEADTAEIGRARADAQA